MKGKLKWEIIIKSYKQIIVTLEVDDVCTESELKVLADDIAEVIEKEFERSYIRSNHSD